MTASAENRGAVWHALGAVAAGVGNNALIHALAAIPLTQLVALRSGGTLIVLLPVLLRQGLRWPSGFSLLRALVEGVASILLIQALAVTSLTFVATISLVIPLGVMALASRMTGERLAWSRQICVLMGFAGALIATGAKLEGNAIGALAALGAALCYVARDLMTRRHGSDGSATEMSAVASLVTLVLALLVTVLPIGGGQGWQGLDASQIGMTVAMIGLYIGSNLLIILATQRGNPSMVAAMRYSSVLWAVLADLLLFGTHPGLGTLGGAVIIVASGLALLRPENRGGAQ